jgi:hypothetical protein
VSKVKSNSKLKTLPEERQREIAEYLRENSLDKAVEWLKAESEPDWPPLSTSKTALSNFLSWWELRQQLRQDEETTDTIIEELKRELPGISDQQIDEFGQKTFSLLSIRRQDLEGFVSVRSAAVKGQLERAKLDLRQKAEERLQEALKFQKEKWMRESVELFLKWSADERSKEILEQSVSNSEKIERLGQLHFGKLWELKGTTE